MANLAGSSPQEFVHPPLSNSYIVFSILMFYFKKGKASSVFSKVVKFVTFCHYFSDYSIIYFEVFTLVSFVLSHLTMKIQIQKVKNMR